ncbi:MAG: ribosomal protein S18-alanine N-acetyltransferase [Armatimonadota bacterium]
MSGVKIRKMEERDVPLVKEIEDISFTRPWEESAFVREVKENILAYYLVAEIDDRVLGYLGSWLVLTEAHITNIAVRPEVRRKKIATKLVQEFIKHLNSLGIEYATLEVKVDNEPAKNLYKKFGFTEAGIRKKYYDNKYDALIMRLELK